MIYVCNLAELPHHCTAVQPSHVLSLVSPEELPPTPGGIAPERHLRVAVHDIVEPLDGCVVPDAEHVAQVIDFLRAWRHDEAPVLIHCVAGISRSMAAALIGLVVKAGGREEEAARALRRAAPHAWPNRRIVALADAQLGCAGRLIAARETMGAAEIAGFGPLVRIDLLP
jgi:predicted protein tyrosine phosphatase